MFFYTEGFQIYKDKYIKKRDQKLTGCLNNKKKLFFKTCQKLSKKHHSFSAKNSN